MGITRKMTCTLSLPTSRYACILKRPDINKAKLCSLQVY